MKKKTPGDKQARKLQEDIFDLISDFDEDCTERGLRRRLIDAHIAAILINLLCVMAAHRETLTSEQLIATASAELRVAAS